MFKWSPPSNRITISASAEKTGAISHKISGEIIPNTGPAIIPSKTSHRTSGTPVFEKISSPNTPTKMIMAAKNKKENKSIIKNQLYYKQNLFKEFKCIIIRNKE